MYLRSKRVGCLVGKVFLGVATCIATQADDWPTYRHDPALSGVTREPLQTPLSLQWTYIPAHPPRPAWPEPGRELNRVAFDYAPAVVAANGLAYFGSSADHKVYALELATGQVRWAVFTGGPVRFAPAVSGDRVFVASDDGCLCCLAASDGRELWRFRAAPDDRKVIGNEQMISRWPLRSGVMVDAGTVYVCAGMWPSEGVYLYALDAATGQVVWQTVDEGSQYKKQPHPPSEAFLGVAPQGYILGEAKYLAIPTGRNMPAVYDRRTGAQLYYRSAPRDWGTRWGGSWCQFLGDYMVTWNTHFQPDIEVLPGEFRPDPKDGMWFFEAATGKELRELPGKLCAVVRNGVLYASGTGKLSAYDFDAWIKTVDPAQSPAPKWETPLERTYTLIAAGDTLFAGGVNTVTAVGLANGKIVWQERVDGQARCLAAAAGKLLVSTTSGRIYCFGPAPGTSPTVVAAALPAPAAVPAAATALAQRVLAETGKTAGYCLVLGAGDGQLLRALALQSDLMIHCAEPEPDRLRSVRTMLDEAGLYGVRVVLHPAPNRPLSFPDYFADLIVAAPDAGRALTRWPADDVYRVLHPQGGRALFIAGNRLLLRGAGSLERWLADGGTPAEEITVLGDVVRVTRGALPGADDWTHQYAGPGRPGASNDTRARVPLEVLWFGRPGPGMMVARHWRGPAPLYANGRMFVVGQRELACVDAYNGRELWRRGLGTKDGAPVNLARWPVDVAGSSVVADPASVYIATGKTCLRLDATTGETAATYQAPEYPGSVPAERIAATQWQVLSVLGDTVLGSMGEGNLGRCIFGLDRESGATRWVYPAVGSVGINALAMDEARVYLLDGATPAEFENAKRRGRVAVSALALCALDIRTGAPVWQVAEGVAGATELRVAHDVVLVTGRNLMTGVSAATGECLYTRNIAVPKVPVIAGETVYIQPYAYNLMTGVNRMQTQPFSGEEVPWTFTRSYGCGQVSGSPNLLMFRSGTLGFYDLAGDSGTYNFAGIRAGCSTNAIAAGGLLLSAPADASCTCSYSLRTTLALAPATRTDRWGLMFTALPATSVQKVALNLGAPGDRRDTKGTLWMAAPHPSVYNARPTYADPFQFEFVDGGGPRMSGAMTFTGQAESRPWLYGSALCGLRKATFDLTIFPSGYLSWPTAMPPAIDGALGDPCWDDYKTVPIDAENATVTFRHDSRNLYLSYARPAAKGADGNAAPWRSGVTQADADIWQDHTFEAFFSPVNKNWQEPSRRCLHLGVSASGTRYDALWEYADLTLPVLDVPPVQVTVDGDASDWGDKGLRMVSLPGPKGKLRPADNLDVSCRIGWNQQGIAVLVDVVDNIVHEDPNPEELWYGDSIEIFLTPEVGTGNYVQTVISPGVDGTHAEVRHRFYDQRQNKDVTLSADFAGRRTENGWRVEMVWPWRNLGIEPADGRQFGMQLFVNDDDGKGRNNWFRARWHPLEHPAQKPSAFQTLQLAAAPSAPLRFARAEKPGPDGLFDAAAPLPFPLTAPPELGAKPEDRAYAGSWQSAVKADANAFTAELAIPWHMLTDAGVDKTTFMIDIASRGLLKFPPVNGRGFQPVVLAPDEATRPRNVTVRLHFAETDDVKAGTRVADIKLQGKTAVSALDVVQAAGGAMRPLVKEVSGLQVTRTLVLEVEPRPGAEAPSLSGIEILAQPE